MAADSKNTLFSIILTIIVIIVIANLFHFMGKSLENNSVTSDQAINRGKNLNILAWEATYTERGFSIPASGPREGYWGKKLRPKVRDSLLGWIEPELHFPHQLYIDKHGCQYYTSREKPKREILIVGGSVAFGAYASSISRTYFHIFGTSLEKKGITTKITVFAAGAWKSSQEVNAFKRYLKNHKPDLVIFINGLNDLTNGATSKALFGEKVDTKDGSPYTLLYHAHDYDQRVNDYLNNMKSALSLTHQMKIDMMVALQPSLVEKKQKTTIENSLLRGSLKPHESAEVLIKSYAYIRAALTKLAEENQHFHFLDCSRIFDSQLKTTFTDMWHFTDAGHEILGRALADKTTAVLKR